MPLVRAIWRRKTERRSRRRAAARRPAVEWLEERDLPSGTTLATAPALTFTSFGTAQAAAFLADPREADLYRAHLGAGDRLSVAVSAQAAGSGLRSLLRVFGASGAQLAADDQEGGDPRLTFQAVTAGDYYVGVSSAPNDAYDPTVLDSGTSGGTTGLYTLSLRDTPAAPLLADLAGASFRLGTDTVSWGNTLPVAFRVENRGGAGAAAFDVQVLLSPDNRFGPSAVVLTTFPVTALAAGREFASGSFTVTLPDAAAAGTAGLPVSGPVYLGLRIDPKKSVPESNPFDQSSVHRGADWESLTIVTPQTSSGTNHTLATADVLRDPNIRVSGTAGVGQADWYQLTAAEAGQLTASVVADAGGTLRPRLTLYGSGGEVLTQSDGATPGGPGAGLTQHLQPGTYYLAVSARLGSGPYVLTSQFGAASSPLDPIPLAGAFPSSVAAVDVNGDGQTDLITANDNGTVSVFPGNGDGTFQRQQTFVVGSGPSALAVADVNGDGTPDLIAANRDDNTLSVLPGNGDGSFRLQRTFAVGSGPSSVAAADINGDGIPDLITANSNDNTVSVLLGNGDGTFQPQQTFAVGSLPDSVAVADVNGDGIPDIITANAVDFTVSVLLGNGDGTFQAQTTYTVGAFPRTVVVADVNGDGKPDLIAANTISNTVSVLLGNGDGTFQPQHEFAVGQTPFSVAVADVNADGKPDLVTVDSFGGTVSVLLGDGDGTFQAQQTFAVGPFPTWVAVADVNGDGRPDLAVANHGSGTVSVLSGNGDGTFQAQQAFTVVSSPRSVAVADVNGDGIPDLITANPDSDTVSVLLGNGDGTFRTQQAFALGSGPFWVAVADVNGDTKPDIITANALETVSVLLGNGDGTFPVQQEFPVGFSPSALAVADVNGDGIPDIITANDFDGTVSVLLGNGDGTFQSQRTFPAGHSPDGVAVVDVNGDGKPDLITANHDDGTVSVLLGNGDGTFQPQQTFPVGAFPRSLAVTDVNGDGKPDIVTANYDGTVSVLLGDGDGTFQAQRTFPAGQHPLSLAVADVNGDGIPDLVTADYGGGTVSVLLGNGDGTFQAQRTFPAGLKPQSVVVADVNGDGKPDLVVTDEDTSSVSLLLGRGDGTFRPTGPTPLVGLRNTPSLIDLDGDRTLDSVILGRSGNILFRRGLPGSDNQFAPPVVLNPGRAARDLTVLRTAAGPVVAAADASFDRGLSSAGHFVYDISLYAVGGAAGPRTSPADRTTAFTTDRLPTRLAAGDLTGDGLDDLVVANSLDDSIQVALRRPDGTFGPPLTLSTGEAPSDISLVDVNGDGLLDIVVSNQGSGDVSVFFNDSSHSFATGYRFRAGTGSYGLGTNAAGLPAVASLAQSVSLAAGDFMGRGRNDLVVINRGADSFTVLPNDGNGGYADPQAALTTSVSDGPLVNDQAGPVVAGDFNGDGRPDLAILMEDRAEVWVYTADGGGRFRHTFSIAAGAAPTALSVVRNPLTGLLDLLVGNPFGDVLHLRGKGDGTFQFAGSRVSLDARDLGDGQPAVLVANQQTDRITIQVPAPGGREFAPVVTLADGRQSTLAPGAVQWARLDRGSPFLDAVVLASGGNSVLVYRGTGFDAAGRPTFAPPVSYPVGQDPVGLTIQDINGDGVPDMLVADQGSNAVSVLFGTTGPDGTWAGVAGPRLNSGGSGPVAVTVRDMNGDGIPDLVVTNGQSGNLAVLPGVGQGFFNDQFKDPNSQILNIPGNPVLAGSSFLGAAGVAVTADGRVVGFNLDNFAATVGTAFEPSAGQAVTAAQELADGNLVVAEEGGTVALLEPVPGSSLFQAAQVLTPLTGIPSDPSALEVLETADGLRVLVTGAGQDRLFVYGLGPSTAGVAVPPEIVILPLTAGGPVPEATTPTEAPLALVVTLTTGLLTAETGAGPGPAAAAGQEVAFVAPRTGAADDATEHAADRNVQESDFGLGIEEMLRQLDLYQRPDERGPDDLFSRWVPGQGPSDAVLALAGFWLGTEEGCLPEDHPPPGPPAAESAPPARVGGTGAGLPAGAFDDPSWLPQTVAAVTVGPAHTAASAAWGALGEVASPKSCPCHGAGPVLGPDGAPRREQALLVALAAGGLTLWAELRLVRGGHDVGRRARPLTARAETRPQPRENACGARLENGRLRASPFSTCPGSTRHGG
jgi:hypothetical protein